MSQPKDENYMLGHTPRVVVMVAVVVVVVTSYCDGCRTRASLPDCRERARMVCRISASESID